MPDAAKVDILFQRLLVSAPKNSLQVCSRCHKKKNKERKKKQEGKEKVY